MLKILESIKVGSNPAAEEELWKRYFSRIALLIKQQLPSRARRMKDEEDIALSVLKSFFRGTTEGSFRQLQDQDDIWQILCMLTRRKTIDHLRVVNAKRRGGNLVRGESAFQQVGDNDPGALDDFSSQKQEEPILVALFTEECERLFAALEEDELIQVARMRMDGYSNEEMAQKMNRSVRSIERKLGSIRAIWSQLEEVDTK